MDLRELAEDLHRGLDAKNAARERALPAARRSIRASANAIRAIHRGDRAEASALITASREALDEGREAVAAHPDVRFSGPLPDAEKEYAEACLTLALVAGEPLPGPVELALGEAPYLNGMAEAIGEGRRAVLDLLRVGDADRAATIMGALEDMFGVLVAMDYPDALTMGLRRTTDVARSLIEKTRGDLYLAFVQKDLREALDEHARRVSDEDPPTPSATL